MQNATFQTTIEVFFRTSQKNLVKMYIQNCISVQECTLMLMNCLHDLPPLVSKRLKITVAQLASWRVIYGAAITSTCAMPIVESPAKWSICCSLSVTLSTLHNKKEEACCLKPFPSWCTKSNNQQLYIAWTFVNLKKKTYNTPQRPVLPIQPKSKCAWLPVKSVAMICLWAIGDLAREAYGYDTSSSR